MPKHWRFCTKLVLDFKTIHFTDLVIVVRRLGIGVKFLFARTAQAV